MVQLPAWARVLVLLIVAGGLYFSAPNFFPRTVQVDLDGLPVQGWVLEEGASLQEPLEPVQLTQAQFDAFDADLTGGLLPAGPVLVGPAPEGAAAGLLLNGDEVNLISPNAASYCRVPSPFLCRQINLGLDLQGGAFAAYEIDEAGYWEDQFKEVVQEIRNLFVTLQDERFQGLNLRKTSDQETDDGGLLSTYDVSGKATAQDIFDSYTYQGLLLGVADDGELIIQVTGSMRTQTLNNLTSRLLDSLNSRFDAFGITEPTIRAAGVPGRVFVELPGQVEIPPIVTGQLELCSVPGDFMSSSLPSIEPLNVADPQTFNQGSFKSVGIDRAQRCVKTEDIANASASLGETGGVQVNVQLRPSAAVTMNNLTQDAWSGGRPSQRYLAVILDGEVLRMDTFEPNLGTSFRIRGVTSMEQATELSTILRSGALPADINEIQSQIVGPELGAAAIQAGRVAAMLAVIAVLIYMIISYGLFGLFANVALIANLSLILGVMSLMGFTLSLPGIAGIVLTIGMAVDANVLVFERMREVWRKTGNVGQSIENGYSQAFSTIFDANITTMIAAMVLFFVGSGAIQGFALTLWIGVATSMFCALAFTRMLIGFWHNPRRTEMPI